MTDDNDRNIKLPGGIHLPGESSPPEAPNYTEARKRLMDSAKELLKSFGQDPDDPVVKSKEASADHEWESTPSIQEIARDLEQAFDDYRDRVAQIGEKAKASDLTEKQRTQLLTANCLAVMHSMFIRITKECGNNAHKALQMFLAGMAHTALRKAEKEEDEDSDDE